MTFAELRQSALQFGALSSDRFAEDVQISAPDDSNSLLSVRVKIEHDTLLNRRGYMAGSGNDSRQNTFDERERIKVTVSRDLLYAKSYPSRPQPATSLVRSIERDPDQRPFTFRGEILYEGDQHAVYVFERPRRVAQGKAL